MKKANFYSMVREKGENIAKLQAGYTDGTYYYYKKDSLWLAIYPGNGLSICSDYTRKAAAERAHNPAMLARIAAAVERQPETVARFTAAVEKATEATA
jgi:ABC-type nitrate/sulfonate/bicarbonate transport system substrate-binding protein